MEQVLEVLPWLPVFFLVTIAFGLACAATLCIVDLFMTVYDVLKARVRKKLTSY